MSQRAQAIRPAGLALDHCRRGAALAAMLCLAGCGGGNALSRIDTDPTILTSSVRAEAAFTGDRELTLDETTIRNVATGIDPEAVGPNGVPWANAGTGSRGAITGILEYSEQGETCRRYTASRERYDGVSLFRGETCFGTNGIWRTRSFQSG